ncbi:MAG TPA: glycosyltransferase family 87 protein [Xanthobacteraceae bacterium]|nr:glycosyltransferase family 87 protein [Xanthobacteraceae bacterium]
MTVQAVHHPSARIGSPRSNAFALACFGLLVANLGFMAALILHREWIVDAAGTPFHTDFTSVYAAGRLALEGHAGAAYDWSLHYAAENAVVPHDYAAYLGWHYPPPFLMIAALLAALPYCIAFLVWVAVTLPLYLVSVRAVVGDKIGWLIGGAIPCLLPNIVSGQNGLFTAALIGGTLVLLPSRPILAGCCLGLLTYKPQFGILFPLLLVAGGYWRAMAAAAVSACLLALATIVVFGVAPWTEFLHWLPLTSHALFAQDSPIHMDWSKFQSLFALVRLTGGSAALAWTLQVTLTAVVALVLFLMWRSRRIAYELKAAAAAAGVLLATPYVYLYDLAIVAVALGFLLRAALRTDFVAGEAGVLALGAVLLMFMPFFGVPVGLMAVAIVALLIARRAVTAGEPQRATAPVH